MTPKDKAKELFLKFRQIPPFSPYTGIDDKEAIECALILVVEIINSVENEHISEIFENYWIKVKNEILKIKSK